MPDYKKAWPKYYYYYEWMRERIAAACGALPAPVLDKMLTQVRGCPAPVHCCEGVWWLRLHVFPSMNHRSETISFRS